MPNEEKMTIDERRKYLRLIKKRYLKAGKLQRGRLLDEMQAVTCLHRKSLIHLMSGSLERTSPPLAGARGTKPEATVSLFYQRCRPMRSTGIGWRSTGQADPSPQTAQTGHLQ
jgi:hypothetical protein